MELQCGFFLFYLFICFKNMNKLSHIRTAEFACLKAYLCFPVLPLCLFRSSYFWEREVGAGGIVTVPSNEIFKNLLAVEYLKPLAFIVTLYLRFNVNCYQYLTECKH